MILLDQLEIRHLLNFLAFLPRPDYKVKKYTFPFCLSLSRLKRLLSNEKT